MERDLIFGWDTNTRVRIAQKLFRFTLDPENNRLRAGHGLKHFRGQRTKENLELTQRNDYAIRGIEQFGHAAFGQRIKKAHVR